MNLEYQATAIEKGTIQMEYMSKDFACVDSLPTRNEPSLVEALNESKEQWKQFVNGIGEPLSEKMKCYLLGEIEDLSDIDDWKEDDIPVTQEAAKTFVRLLLSLKSEICPGIGCDYEGHPIMYWKNGCDSAVFTCYPRNWVFWDVSIQDGNRKFDAWGKDRLANNAEMLKKQKNFFRVLLADHAPIRKRYLVGQ